MYAIITNMVLAAVALMVVQAETYAMLEAVAYARRVDGALARKFRVGSARYEWASVIWHETSVEKPAYSIVRPLALFLVTVLGSMAAMDFGLGVVEARWPCSWVWLSVAATSSRHTAHRSQHIASR